MFDSRPKILLALTVVLFFWRLVLTTQFTFLESPDLAYQVLPWYQVQASSWHDGEFPLWDPFQWGGQPVLGQMQPGGANPLNWPLFLTPLRDGFIQLKWVHRHYVFMHLLAAFFFYALARWLGRSRWASVIGGIAFSTAGYIGTITWPQMLHGAIWIPLIFLLLHRTADSPWGPRAWARATLCGGAIGLALLSGHHQTPIFTLLALTGVFLWFFAKRWQRTPWLAIRWGFLYAAVALVAVLVSALQLLPALEYGGDAYRWVETPDPVTSEVRVPYWAQYPLRLYPVTLIGLVMPRAHFQVSTFVGVGLLTFALLGVGLAWREKWVKLYSGVALLGIAYAVGPYSVLHGLIYAVLPFADKARSAGHSVFVAQFALIILACYGLDALRTASAADPIVRWAKWGLLAFGSACLFILYGEASQGKMDAPPGDQFVLASLFAFLLAGLLHAAPRKYLTAASVSWLLFGLIVFELGTGQWVKIVDRRDPEQQNFLKSLQRHPEIMAFLKDQPRPFRIEFRTGEQHANLGSWHGIEVVDGFLASVSRDLYEFFSPDWNLRRRMLNMRYTVTNEGAWPNQVEVYAAPDGWKVYRNEDAWPRTWIASDASAISTIDKHPVAPPADSCEGNTVAWQSSTRQHVTARASMNCPGYVVFAEPYLPGWEARVDGEPAQMFRAYTALRAIRVPAGEHTIETLYRPKTVYAGAALSLLGFLACLAAFLYDRRRVTPAPA